MLESCVREEVEARVEALSFGVDVALRLDWAHLSDQSEYAVADVVALTRELGALPEVALIGEEGLEWLWSENPESKAAMAESSELLFQVDLSDEIEPPQVRFVPRFYRCEQGDGRFALTMRRHRSNDRGCGMVAEFVLDPSEAARKEEAEIVRIAAKRRLAEIKRRERETAQIHSDNESARRKYAIDIGKYERALRDYEKKSTAKHQTCKGSGWIACGDSWHKGRSSFKICKTCKGKNGRKCAGCRGSGLRYPKAQEPGTPKEPVARTVPRHKPIDSTNWRAGI